MRVENAKPKKSKRRGMRRGIYILPNLLTSGSLFCGFYSIIATFNGKYLYAAVAILAAIFFDGIDGKIARLTRSTSRFGVEFDSLSDLVAFGVAPGLFIFSWALWPYGRLGWLAAFLYVACGALRLARFNVQVNTVESQYFRGLPIPAAASLIATAFLFFNRLGESGETKHLFILPMIYVLAFLMVSNIRYHSFKNLELLKRKRFSTLVAMILAIVVIVAEPEIMLFVFASFYLMLGPMNAILMWYKKKGISLGRKKTESVLR